MEFGWVVGGVKYSVYTGYFRTSVLGQSKVI